MSENMKYLVLKLILITILFIYEVKTNFYAGRIKPGKFEYPLLNGWMLTEEAKLKCENDLACGGFTFKGRQIVILQFFLCSSLFFSHFSGLFLCGFLSLLFPLKTARKKS